MEAVRVRADGLSGPWALLAELWQRYRLPVAVTEAHNGCTREEQLRWFMEAWEAARTLRAQGADIRAVTAWSLLGAYDWDSLLTRDRGHYEPGAFDVRGADGTPGLAPRPTALAHLLTDLAAGREPAEPTLDSPGWWRRDTRLAHGFSVAEAPSGRGERGWGVGGRGSGIEPSAEPTPGPREGPAPVVIVGATGTLGRAFARICEARGLPYVLLARRELDICEPGAISGALDRYQPWAVVNAAGYVRVDDAEREAEACYRANADGPAALAAACASRGVRLVTFSSDLVFDGSKEAPYVESDPVSQLNVYGRSKAEAEARVLREMPSALVVRTSAFFGPWDEYNFVTIALRTLAEGRPVRAGSDRVSPTYVPDLVNACLDLLIDRASGLWHLASRGAVTWSELARLAAEMAGFDARLVEERPAAMSGTAAPRPAYSVLGSERGWLMPPLDDALERYMKQEA